MFIPSRDVLTYISNQFCMQLFNPVPPQPKMAVSVAIWSQDLEPNKRNVYVVENDIRISGASLAAELSDTNARTVVELVVKIPDDYDVEDDEESGERPLMHNFVLCALTAGKVCLILL